MPILTDDGFITKATNIQSIYYRIISVFTNFHKVQLQKALENSLSEAVKYKKDDLDDKKKIFREFFGLYFLILKENSGFIR